MRLAPTAALLRDIEVDRPPPVPDLVESRCLGTRLHEAVLHRLDDAGLIDVTRVVLGTAHVGLKKRGGHTGPSPVDRGKPGSKTHTLSDVNGAGLPLLVGISAGNTHDSEGLKPMVAGHQTRHDPDRVKRTTRAAPPGHRAHHVLLSCCPAVLLSWLSGYRRLSARRERNPRNYLAFLRLAAALCCYKRLVRLTT